MFYDFDNFVGDRNRIDTGNSIENVRMFVFYSFGTKNVDGDFLVY